MSTFLARVARNLAESNNPKVIACYFFNCVADLQLVPRLIRADRGLENVVVAGLQKYYRKDGEDDMAGINSFKFGPSSRSQQIETWLSMLRRIRFGWWINFFKDLFEAGHLDPSKPFRSEIMRFCFIGLIQTELEEVKDMWKNHKIRPVRNGECPSGRANNSCIAPNLAGGINDKFPVSEHNVILTKRFCTKPSLFLCSDDITVLCHAIIQEKGLT